MRFSEDFIDKVRGANDLVEFISQHTQLRGSGHRMMGKCPFPDHSDKSPSFSVNVDMQTYYCFGCKKSGNIFHFVQAFNGMSFPEAVEYLAQRASLPMPVDENDKAGAKEREIKDAFFRINETSATFYQQRLKALPDDHVFRAYLRVRGLTPEIVERFRLGIAPDDWQGLTHHLRAEKLSVRHAETLGLLKPKRESRGDETHFDLFRARLMFPIVSGGHVVGFGGRTLRTDKHNEPKYLNSSDSPVFKKGRILYGLNVTGATIRNADLAVVVEGYMDALALYSAGIDNVAAILGTAFTPDHAKSLQRYTRNVVMLLDGDQAGILGAERSLPVLLEAGLMAKGFILPEGMDPDDFVKKHGADRMKEEIARAPDLFTLLLTQRWLADYRGSPTDKIRVVERTAPVLKVMRNRDLMDLYLVELSRQLDVDMAWLRKALTQAVRAGETRAKPAPQPIAPPPERGGASGMLEPSANLISLKKVPREEAFVLSLLLQSEGLMKQLLDQGTDALAPLILHPGIQETLKLAIQRYRANPAGYPSLAADLASRVDNPAVLMCATRILPPERDFDMEKRIMRDYILALERRAVRTLSSAKIAELMNNPTPENLASFQRLQQARHRLSNERQSNRDEE